MKKNKRAIKLTLLIIGLLLIFMMLAFSLYVSDYYRADNIATETLESKNIKSIGDDLTLFLPDKANGSGLVFYPGGKVEDIAYAPLLDKLSDRGITCVLVEMPFNLAVFNIDGADKVFETLKLDSVDKWYIGGHSLGGAMASSYASDNQEKISGLILLGSYIYGDYPPKDTLTIYGSLENDIEDNIDYSKNIVEISGGNHSQFGNYGLQEGDPRSTISREDQQKLVVDSIVEFVVKDQN